MICRISPPKKFSTLLTFHTKKVNLKCGHWINYLGEIYKILNICFMLYFYFHLLYLWKKNLEILFTLIPKKVPNWKSSIGYFLENMVHTNQNALSNLYWAAWHVTMTCDTWREMNILSKFQLPSSYAFEVKLF